VKYFITGGSGLIGQFLIPKIEANGDEWVNFDRSISDRNDIMSLSDIRTRLFVEQPDVVIHLAAQSGVEPARQGSGKSLNLNIMGTVNVLEACKTLSIKNVVVASSNHVYGNQKEWPVKEDALLNQRDLYSVSKICADVITQAYAHNYDMNTVAVRLTNAYGPGDMHDDHIIPGTIQSLLRGESPVIRSDGQIRKSYLYGTDCADAFITIAENCEVLRGQSVNVVGCKPISSMKLVETMIEMADVDVRPTILGEATDQNHEDMDSSKMTALGWEPKIDIYEGLEKTYTWFAERAKQTVAV
jgi:CDP-glucose 4,6-dehydratase